MEKCNGQGYFSQAVGYKNAAFVIYKRLCYLPLIFYILSLVSCGPSLGGKFNFFECLRLGTFHLRHTGSNPTITKQSCACATAVATE
jgi:hypothetical protein